MTFEDALKIIKNGGKITNKIEVKGNNFLSIVDGWIRWKSGNSFMGSVSCLQDDWEEYIEPRKYLTHREAMQALIDGKKLSKDFWNDRPEDRSFIYLDEDGFTKEENGDNFEIYLIQKSCQHSDKYFIVS